MMLLFCHSIEKQPVLSGQFDMLNHTKWCIVANHWRLSLCKMMGSDLFLLVISHHSECSQMDISYSRRTLHLSRSTVTFLCRIGSFVINWLVSADCCQLLMHVESGSVSAGHSNFVGVVDQRLWLVQKILRQRVPNPLLMLMFPTVWCSVSSLCKWWVSLQCTVAAMLLAIGSHS